MKPYGAVTSIGIGSGAAPPLSAQAPVPRTNMIASSLELSMGHRSLRVRFSEYPPEANADVGNPASMGIRRRC